RRAVHSPLDDRPGRPELPGGHSPRAAAVGVATAAFAAADAAHHGQAPAGSSSTMVRREQPAYGDQPMSDPARSAGGRSEDVSHSARAADADRSRAAGGAPAERADLNAAVPPYRYNPSAWKQRIPI